LGWRRENEGRWMRKKNMKEIILMIRMACSILKEKMEDDECG
jgi:hypothetical protein